MFHSRVQTAALVLLLILPGLLLFGCDSQVLELVKYESTNHDSSADELAKANSTGPLQGAEVFWHSRDHPSPSPISGDEVIKGDHIILNASLPAINGSYPVGCVMEIFYADRTISRNSSRSFILFDTYHLMENAVVDVNYTGLYDANQQTVFSYWNITLVNFFAPAVELIAPNGGESWTHETHRILWRASDLNYDDRLWFRVFFSNDGGVFWQLLAAGHFSMQPDDDCYYFDWTITLFSRTNEGLIRVIALDNDTVHAGLPHPTMPNITMDSFWPALSSSDKSDSVFSFGGDPSSPSYLSISSPQDITVYEGEANVSLVWHVESSATTDYFVERDNQLVLQGTILSGDVEVPLDELREGEYSFTISVFIPGIPGIDSDTVKVTILPQQVSTISGVVPLLATPIGFAVVAGAMFGLPGIIVAFALRKWKRKENRYDETKIELNTYPYFRELFSEELEA